MRLSRKYLCNPLVSGTIILTAAGFATKIIGFFYRIFLSRIFPEESLGIIGLITPVSMLVHAACAAGIQNAITKYVAASKTQKIQAFSYLFCGILLSLALSIITAICIFQYAPWIADCLIHEPRTTSLLRILALSFPLASLHACINGYFYGYQKTGIPSWSILIEQFFRVFIAYLLYRFFLNNNQPFPLAIAIIGLFAGECASAVFSSFMLYLHSMRSCDISDVSLLSLSKCRELLQMACPLSLNRICLSLFATIEAIQLPVRLVESGLSSAQALSLYGVFSGMAFPTVMFPCAITGSAATLLLPSIAEAQSQGNKKRIRQATILTIVLCLLMGFGCMCFFLLFAEPLGLLLFQSVEAASQLRSLAFVCPFLYLSGMLSSILHGLGKTGITFVCSIASLTIRLICVLFLIPMIGFRGYFYGILCSQICLDLLLILALHHNIIYN